LNSFDGKVMQKEDTILVSVQTTLSCQLMPELKYCIRFTLLVLNIEHQFHFTVLVF